MREQLLEKIPEIAQITDAGLRSKTVAVFLDALTLGGWTVADLDRVPCTVDIPNNPVGLLTHTRSVVQTALVIADVLELYYSTIYHLDRDILRCGAILHDVGRLLEYAENEQLITTSVNGHLLPHAIGGAALAMKHGLPTEVIHIIATHRAEHDHHYRTPAAIIVRHASAVNFEPLFELLKNR